MNRFFRSICLAAAAGAFFQASAQIQLDYYRSLDGLSGAQLKNAIHTLVCTDVNMLKYGSGSATATSTWWGFYVTDRDVTNNQVIDRYSAEVFTFGTRGQSVSGMNIEHSFPKSWWGGEQNNAYKDLYNLMPSQTTINNWKGNYPMGQVDDVWRTNNVTEIGTAAGESTAAANRLWEPADKWKGDFARDYFYMATAYQDFTWTGDQAPRILSKGDYPTLKKWATDLYRKWAKADKVSEIESTRNNNVQWMQGNRNPYVDYPNLAEYVWGDSINKPFNPLTSVKSQTFVGGGTFLGNPAEAEVIYSNAFIAANGGTEGGCTSTKHSGSRNPWSYDPQYGWKAVGATGPSDAIVNHECNATLNTPVLDLTGYKAAWVKFSHVAKWIEDPSSAMSVEIALPDNTTEELFVPRWPLGINWDKVPAGIIDLTPWCGKKVRLGFHYTSTTSVAGTWQISGLTVSGYKGDSGILIVDADSAADIDAPAEYYTIDGRRLASPEGYRGILIIRRGTTVTKTLLR